MYVDEVRVVETPLGYHKIMKYMYDTHPLHHIKSGFDFNDTWYSVTVSTPDFATDYQTQCHSYSQLGPVCIWRWFVERTFEHSANST